MQPAPMLAALLLLAPVAAAPAPAPGAAAEAPPQPALDPVAKAKLRAGVVVSTAAEEASGAAGTATGWAIAKCPPARIFAILTRHDDFAEWMPRMKAIRVLSRGERSERALQTIDASLSDISYALDYSWDPASLRVEFRLAKDVPHELAEVEGHWQLWPLDGGKATLIEYGNKVDIGRYVPAFIRSYLSDRGLKDAVAAVRKRGEEQHAAARAP